MIIANYKFKTTMTAAVKNMDVSIDWLDSMYPE